jgi:hypothetical protein
VTPEQIPQRDFGRLEGKLDALVLGVTDLKETLKELSLREKDARENLENGLNERINDLEKRHGRLERLSWVLHGAWISIMGLLTLPANVKSALAALLRP